MPIADPDAAITAADLPHIALDPHVGIAIGMLVLALVIVAGLVLALLAETPGK